MRISYRALSDLITHIMTLAALLIALWSLHVSQQQLADARQHNRISVRPRMVITPYLEGENGRNGLYISNNGFGPGQITNMRVSVNGKTFEGLGTSRWAAILKEANIQQLCFRLGWPAEDAPIKAGDQLVLLEMKKNDLLPKNLFCNAEVVKFLTKQPIHVTLDYASLYDEPFRFDADVHFDLKAILSQ